MAETISPSLPIADWGEPLRAITLYPEYAALVANGDKIIETRPRRCNHRGLVVIHAGASDPAARGVRWVGQYMVGTWTDHVVHAEPCDCDEDEEVVGDRCMEVSGGYRALLTDGGAFAPQLAMRLHPGAIVAVANLTDCLPIVEGVPIGQHDRHETVIQVLSDIERLCVLQRAPLGGESLRDLTAEMSCGDFTPGRFGLLLADVTPLSEPVPCRGNRAVPWVVPDDVAERVRAQLAEVSDRA